MSLFCTILLSFSLRPPSSCDLISVQVMSGELEAVLGALAVGKVRREGRGENNERRERGTSHALDLTHRSKQKKLTIRNPACASPPLPPTQVPALWLAQSFPSLKPLASYMQDLHARLSMLATWAKTSQPPAFWISGFFFTPSFTTAVLQVGNRTETLFLGFRGLGG